MKTHTKTEQEYQELLATTIQYRMIAKNALEIAEELADQNTRLFIYIIVALILGIGFGVSATLLL